MALTPTQLESFARVPLPRHPLPPTSAAHPACTLLAGEGYVVLPRAVAADTVDRARAFIDATVDHSQRMVRPDLHLGSAKDPALGSLLAGLLPALRSLVGDTELLVGSDTFDPQNTAASIALVYPSERPERGSRAGQVVGGSGYRLEDVPFYGWQGHIDGIWSGGSAPPDIGADVPADSDWYTAVGTNGCPLVVAEDDAGRPASSVSHFTCLVGVALSDMLVDGMGQLGVLPRAHQPLAEVFRAQREQGGPLGPGGPGWEREDAAAPNRHGVRYYPDVLRRGRPAHVSADGKLWPEPTLVKLARGDAVVVMHGLPHSATRNESDEIRHMVYFRATRADRPAGQLGFCPDALCDPFLEFDGLGEAAVVAAQRSRL